MSPRHTAHYISYSFRSNEVTHCNVIDYLGLFPRPHNLHTTEKCSGGHLKVSAKITVHILEVLDLPHEHEAVTPGLVRHGDRVLGRRLGTHWATLE